MKFEDKDIKEFEDKVNKLKKNKKLFSILGYTFLGLSITCFIASFLCFELINLPDNTYNIPGQILISVGGFSFLVSMTMFLLRFFLCSINLGLSEEILKALKNGGSSEFVTIKVKESKDDDEISAIDKKLLEQYKKLKDQGIISEEDYKKKEEELTHSSKNLS